MNLNPNQRIYDVLQSIHQGQYRIPNIQRGYEWNQERVTKLLDSIMSGYPIGAIMVWRPTEEIRADILTRPFIKDFESTRDYVSDESHPSDQEAHLVLDGQQRLQSLYLSFFGSYDKKRVYIQIDYVPTEAGDDTDYRFEFLIPEEARARPAMVHVAEVIQLDSDTKFDFAEKRAHQLCAHVMDATIQAAELTKRRATISKNIDRFIERFNVRPALLFQEVEKKHNYDHVLEIFERVNSGGMVLDKSDLLFSTLKLKLQRMEHKFIEAIAFLNHGSRYTFNTDFLIKTCLVVFGQKAKYDVAKLKNDTFTAIIDARFDDLDYCLRQMSAWLDDIARIKCNRFLRSRLALIPILDYMLLSGKRDKPEGEEAQAMVEYLYMAFFRRLFSRAPDNVLDQLHDGMVSAVARDKNHFPIEMIRSYMQQRQGGVYQLNRRFFHDDADLALNIVDGGVLQIDLTNPNLHPYELKLEVDHIFPRARLVDLGMGDIANHFGNYRLIVMPANRRKSAHMPDAKTGFFGRDMIAIQADYQAARADLNRETYMAFLTSRADYIRATVSSFLCVPVEPSV